MNQGNNTIKIKPFILNTIFVVLFLLLNIGFAQAATSQELVNLTNSTREKNGLNGLTVNVNLTNAAQAKAEDMFRDNYFAHIAPDGTTPWDFIKGAGYEYSYAGENLAIGYTDGEELLQAWMDSPLHRANILNDKFAQIGIAVVNGTYEDEDTDIVVQMFGTPLEVTTNDNTNININNNNINVEIEGVEDVAIEEQPEAEATVPAQDVTPVAEIVVPSVSATPQIILTEDKQNVDTNNKEVQFDTNKILVIGSIGAGLVLLVATYLIMRYQNSNKIA